MSEGAREAACLGSVELVSAPFEILQQVLDLGGVPLRAWALAWARVAPALVLVPAFGLLALPAATRAALGLALGLGVAPALVPTANSSGPFALAIVTEALRGLPVALSAATALWIATMAGGAIDDLRGAREEAHLPNVESGATPVGAVFAMLAAMAFLHGGGAARVARALIAPESDLLGPLGRSVASLTHGVEIAVAVAAPIAVVAIVVEVALALIARAASPAYLLPVFAPLKAVLVLGAALVLLDRVLELLTLLAARAP